MTIGNRLMTLATLFYVSCTPSSSVTPSPTRTAADIKHEQDVRIIQSNIDSYLARFQTPEGKRVVINRLLDANISLPASYSRTEIDPQLPQITSPESEQSTKHDYIKECQKTWQCDGLIRYASTLDPSSDKALLGKSIDTLSRSYYNSAAL
ncbi:MAG: hypothetical protein AABX82_02930, partial [Nanoarchaeota archaeon]